MNVTLTPKTLRGTIRLPASKSQAHRVIIGAALSDGTSRITHVSGSQDITATLSCMEALGAIAEWEDETTVTITGMGGKADSAQGIMDCGESGSTLRFLIPVALAAASGGTFRGHGRLMERPQEPYFDIFREKGIAWKKHDDTLTVSGKLIPGEYTLPGNVSSQFITGLLYALPLLEGDSTIRLTTELESSGYVDMTLDALRKFGIRAERTDTGWFIPGSQHYTPANISVEGDFSQAGFFYAMKGMGCPLEIEGLNPDSCQGDRVVIPYMEKLNGAGTVTLDVRECPDLVPPLAVRAALRPGAVTHIVNAGRLRIKESDRLASVTAVLNLLGAEVEEFPDSLTIHGKETLPGGVTADSWNDHRIAMMAAVASCRCEAPITIAGAECVRKSYPAFWEDFAALGGQVRKGEQL